MINSVWGDTALPTFPRLEGDISTDVLIIGGGMAGILCADRLHQAGIDYVLIEGDRIGRGISRNTTAKITSQHGLIYHKLIKEFGRERARLYWEANEAALDQYRKMAERFGCDFESKDNYIYSKDNLRKLEKELQALDRLHIPSEFTKTLSMPFPVAGAVRFRNQAQFHPLKFLNAIAQGLRIYENTSAQAFEGNKVLTDWGKIKASKIIVATHFPILNKHGAYFLKMYQHRSYVLGLKNGPQVGGMFLDEAKDGLSFRNHGDMLILGGGAHRTGKQGSGWKVPEEFARRNYPNAQIAYRWAAQDCMTLDAVPYIGKYGGKTDGIYVASGFNKWGMTSSMAAAMVLSDLVQGRENPYTSLFSPQRSMLRPQLAVNAIETTFNLLTPTAPRCPHMGCALKWNRQEHSWDCPCHGSRFSAEGKVLDNPAMGNLKK